MTALSVVGVDPGPTPGIVRLELEAGRLVGVDVVQCTARTLPQIVHLLTLPGPALVAIERFVTRGRATADQALTRDQVGALQAVHHGAVLRSASQVKPWATDTRLDACRLDGKSLLDLTKGMRHSRDAARHALYAAVRDGGLTDPLSKGAHR